MPKKKIKAFTLIEVIITMIISSVLLFFSIKAVSVMSSISTYHTMNIGANSTLLNLRLVLNRKISEAEYLTNDEESGFKLCLDTDSCIEIILLQDKIIVGNNEIADTFNIRADSLKFKYLSCDSTIIREISFQVVKNGLKYPFHFIKEYTNQFLFNLPTYAP